MGPGTQRFADRVRLNDGRLLCADCVAAIRAAPRLKDASDLDAAYGLDTEARVRMGAGAALHMGNAGR